MSSLHTLEELEQIIENDKKYGSLTKLEIYDYRQKVSAILEV
ncbi:hypothetical protein ACEYW6_31725 [Nostoc sp. UIC 10607]